MSCDGSGGSAGGSATSSLYGYSFISKSGTRTESQNKETENVTVSPEMISVTPFVDNITTDTHDLSLNDSRAADVVVAQNYIEQPSSSTTHLNMNDSDVGDVHIRHLNDGHGHFLSHVDIDAPKDDTTSIQQTTLKHSIYGAALSGSSQMSQVPLVENIVSTNRAYYNGANYTQLSDGYEYKISRESQPYKAHVDIRKPADGQHIGTGASLMVTGATTSHLMQTSSFNMVTNDVYNVKTSNNIGMLANGSVQTTEIDAQTQTPLFVSRREKRRDGCWCVAGCWPWCLCLFLLFLLVAVIVIIGVVVIFTSKGGVKYTKPTTIETCKDVNQIDLVFAIDASGSLGSDNFNLVIDFLATLASHIEIGKERDRVGALTYSSDATVAFHLNEFETKEGIIGGLRNITFDGGSTMTGEALLKIRDEMLQERNGDRPSYPDVIVIITDGASKGYNPVTIANELKDMGTTIFAIGIRDDEFKETELVAMASTPDTSFVIESYADLAEAENKITSTGCFQRDTGHDSSDQ